MQKPIIHHIPVCPFSQRVEILLAEKGLSDAIEFNVIDITQPRPDWLLRLTGGTTSLPVLVDEEGRTLKESLVILRYIEERFSGRQVARQDPYERGLERLMITRESSFGMSGYRYVMNRDRSKTADFRGALLKEYRWLDEFLTRHNPRGDFLFDSFGLPEVVFTPLLIRFAFLEYYEGFSLPETDEFRRVSRFQQACLAHPNTKQVPVEKVIKLYYDYAIGAGNGALPEGRTKSTFCFDPDWPNRPWPPKDKYDRIASDEELGLI